MSILNKNAMKKVTTTALATLTIVASTVPAFAQIGGYAIVPENATVNESIITGGNFAAGRNTVSIGNLRGTWVHGNIHLGLTLFSQVTGNSSSAAGARTRGLGTATNGNGITTGRHDGWTDPGVPSRSETTRTPHGTNRAQWNLDN